MSMDDDSRRPRKRPILSKATAAGQQGTVRKVTSVLGHKDPVCSKCGKPTTSHVDHTGAVWCHKCWVKYGVEGLERQWKEELPRRREAMYGAETKRLVEDLDAKVSAAEASPHNRELRAVAAEAKRTALRYVEDLKDQAADATVEQWELENDLKAEGFTLEEEAGDATLWRRRAPTCAKCGTRPAVAEYELEENEHWEGYLVNSAWLCDECANEVFPKEYDEEERPDDGQLPVPGEPAICTTHGVEDHDCEEG